MKRILSRIAIGTALLTAAPFAMVSGAAAQDATMNSLAVPLNTEAATASHAAFTPNPDPNAAPSARPAAGPEKTTLAAASRPVSGKNPSAGPQFVKSGSTWNVVSPDVVLQNTVTDADGNKSTLTFEVWTTNADGTPKAQVNVNDNNAYGVIVSEFVPSGGLAKVSVPYGKLKLGVTYTFHTSGFNGSLYETTWSPWANFKINPYVTFPAPQASSTIDPVAQKETEFSRSNPGASLARDADGTQNCPRSIRRGASCASG
ncbi:hypothetical protein NGF19_07810 [Streptomyces sp. RY43-2]|uniref:Uncharacterized protein n=1 Tax=Streptomyces macrolidinus TaxID=2952607 RepID=A0ABT0ZB92_9ACTN|nr:hypothetical protein [Streptomyces macrolidinus]MCN9240702.1 hypothetical protein [Streptomyces macrolidinus]